MSVKAVSCSGGLNTESALMDLRPGEAAALVNVEVNADGTYTTMRGIERFDGRIEPNKAEYYLIGMWTLAGITVGDLIVASPSGGYATVVGIDGADVNNCSIAVVSVGGPPIQLTDTLAGNAIKTLPRKISARDAAAHKDYLKTAAAILRAPIQAVPGVGPVRGVVGYKNEIYAFRDHADGTTARMYRGTLAGWEEVDSGGLIKKGGTYRFRVHNFLASAGTQKLYFVNGVNKALQFDGAVFTELSTGMPTDTPTSIEVLPSDVLLLGYDNGSLMFSGPNTPNNFTASVGGEIGCSDKIIDLALQPDERCAVFCERSIRMLSGKTKSSISMSVFDDETGARPGSVTNIGDSIFLSKSGLTRLSRVQTFGNFDMTALDRKFKSAVRGDEVRFSIPVKSKNQYRIFTARGFVGLTFSGNDLLGAFTGSYPVHMNCGSSAIVNGEEYLMLGGDDGYVYRADVGTSHAGEPYTRLVRLAHNHLGGPQTRKKLKRLTINADCERTESLSVFAELDYSSGDSPRQSPFSVSVGGNESYYGAAVFGESVFGTASDAINQVYLSGVARAIAVALVINSDTAEPVRIGGYLIEFEARAKTR